MVVCKMFGYTGGTGLIGQGSQSYHRPQHYFSQGTGDILLDWVDCRGSEVSLFSCQHRGIGVLYCSHGEDAGVRCNWSGKTFVSSSSKLRRARFVVCFRLIAYNSNSSSLYFLAQFVALEESFTLR